jgi:hypothetical protein
VSKSRPVFFVTLMDHSLSGFLSIAVAEVILLTAFGIPIAWWLARAAAPEQIYASIIAAPLLGCTGLIWATTLAYRLGLSPIAISLAIWILIWTFVLFNTNAVIRRTLLRSTIRGLIAIACVAAFCISINSMDIVGVGALNYFPRTNDDTFSYLGHIDQLRWVGRPFPPLLYPAGYGPVYQHAVNLRGGVASFVAALADVFHLDTHVAFFCTIRVFLVLIPIGLVSLLIACGVVNSLLIACCIIIFCCGNFMLHEVLQQFLSSSAGVTCAVTTLLIGALTIHCKPLFTGIVGLSCGVYCITSPEAFPVILIGLVVCITAEAFVGDHSARCFLGRVTILLWRLGCFLTGFMAGISPVSPGILVDTFSQLSTALQTSHPGDWIAQFGYILQASGVVPFYTGEPFTSRTVIEQAVAVATLALTASGLLIPFVAKKSRCRAAVWVIFFPCPLFILCFSVFYYRHAGYKMLKMWDYHMFYPAIIAGAWLHYGSVYITRVIWRMTAVTAAASFIVAFVFVSVRNKNSVFKDYAANVRQGPSLQSYEYTKTPSTTGIHPDLHFFPLNLFLYVNRWRDTPIWFEGSARYVSNSSPVLSSISHAFRLGTPAARDANFLDINRSRDLNPENGLVPFLDYIQIDEGNGWLPVSGVDYRTSYRWLGQRGEFTLYRPSNISSSLHVRLYRGPDMPLTGSVSISIGGRTLANIPANLLPQSLDIPFSVPAQSDILHGSFVVSGDPLGVRNVSVAGLYVTATQSQ